MSDWTIRLIESPDEMQAVETLQREVWSGSDLDILPANFMLTAIHNGGLVIGAYSKEKLVGFVFGFPGLDEKSNRQQVKHCSHMLGVHPDWQDAGIGFALKRAQWQMVRRQAVDRITWTYDPLLSRNAHLNITKLGAVCDTYRRNEYGEMRDDLNVGLPSDRFQVDWWINSQRVERRLSRHARPHLKLDALLSAGVQILEAVKDPSEWIRPADQIHTIKRNTVLVEIPSDFQDLRRNDISLATRWRFYGREAFEQLFSAGYLVTDFVFDSGRSFYCLTHA